MAALPFIAAAAQFVSTIAETQQARAVGEAQALGIEEQAATVSRAAGAQEEAQRMAAKFQMGELRAAAGQKGISESVTFGDVYGQAGTMAELDALNIRYTGEGRRKGLLYEAAVTRAARPKWGPALLAAGTKALGAYGQAGGTFGSGGGAG
jgi:hypothetical protein